MIAAETTFILGVVESNPILSPPFANSLHAVNAKVVFSHISIARINDSDVPFKDVTPVVPYVPGDLSSFMVGNIASVQSVNHCEVSPEVGGI